MTERPLPPAETGTDFRLDALIGRLDRVIDLLTPAAPVEPVDGETVELREPADVLAAKPNLTGASDVRDANGNVIAQARGIGGEYHIGVAPKTKRPLPNGNDLIMDVRGGAIVMENGKPRRVKS